MLTDDKLNYIDRGTVQNRINTASNNSLVVFLRNCKKQGFSLDETISDLTVNWGVYCKEWKKSGIAMNYDSCLAFLETHWDSI